MKSLLGAGVTLFCLWGCGPANVSKRVAQAGGTEVLRVSMNTAPTTLDPAKVQDIETTGLLRNVYEGLVKWDEGNHLVANLAFRWDVSNGGKTYTFSLKPKVKFQNGTPLTAQDVKFSLERACRPEMASPTAASYLNDIVGAKEVLEGKSREISGVKVVDPSTVAITIDAPRAYFLAKLTYPCAHIVPQSIGDGEIKSPDKAVGTGPFSLASLNPDLDVTLNGFKDYHGGSPKLAKVVFVVAKDSQTRLNKYKAGELLVVGLPRNELAQAKKSSDLASQLVLNPQPAVAYIGLNSKAYEPFKNPQVRMAIAYAVDRDKIVGSLLGGANPIAHTILPPGIEGHRENVTFYPYGIPSAKAMLASAGFPDPSKMPPLKICYRAQTPETKVIAEAIEQEIHGKLGIPVELREMEWGSLLKERNADKLPMFILSWYADYLDPQNFLSILLTKNASGNHFGYDNPKVDDLCAKADTETDPKTRTSLYQQAEDLILADAAFIPLYYVVEGSLQSPKVQGWKRNLFGDLPLHSVSLQ